MIYIDVRWKNMVVHRCSSVSDENTREYSKFHRCWTMLQWCSSISMNTHHGATIVFDFERRCNDFHWFSKTISDVVCVFNSPKHATTIRVLQGTVFGRRSRGSCEIERQRQLATYGHRTGGQDDGSLKKLPQIKTGRSPMAQEHFQTTPDPPKRQWRPKLPK